VVIKLEYHFQSGTMLARRLAKTSDVLTNYENIPTTVFTPLEYGTIGYSEEDAISKFGEDNLEIYHKNFWPLEWTLPKRPDNACYAKLICHKGENERVLGLHYLGPHAGEVTQGFTGMMVMGATKVLTARRYHFISTRDIMGVHYCNLVFFTVCLFRTCNSFH